MLTYLDIIVHHSTTLIGEEATPAGVLYFHVHNPMINAKKILTLEEIEKELFKKFKMNGLVLGEENADSINGSESWIRGNRILFQQKSKRMVRFPNIPKLQASKNLKELVIIYIICM